MDQQNIQRAPEGLMAREPVATASEGERIVGKIAQRLIPLLVACFFVAYLDRVNIGFAALTMNKALGFTPEFFGWAAGVFFLTYCLLEAPSNYIMHRVGARIWIARIMVTWGVVSALMAFVWNETSFVTLRLLLGAAEAGFAPGVILYLTYWIPAAQRARVMSGFLFAVPLSSAIGAPISSLVLTTMNGVADFDGWRWLFFIEAIPSILLGVACFFYLPGRPAESSWLSPREKEWLQSELAQEAPHKEESLWRALLDFRVLALGFAYFGIVLALYGLGFWLPQIIRADGFGVIAAGFLTAVPYIFGGFAMVSWSRRSDARKERAGHAIVAALIAGVGLVCAAYAPSPTLSMVAVAVAAMGTFAFMPVFWSFSTEALGPNEAVIGVAVINSVGNVAGFAGPYLVGLIRGASGEFHHALLALAAGPLLAVLFVFLSLRLRR